MVDCWLPYGNTEVYVSVELDSLIGIATQKTIEPEKTSTELITDAIMEPIGITFEELIEPGTDVVIAVDIYSNPHAVTLILTELTKILVELIIPKDNITIILGNGESDKENTLIRDAIRASPELRNISLIDHNRNTNNLIGVGDTHKGTPVELNQRYHNAKLRIVVGETRIDPLIGFAGAHCSVIPGLSSVKTIREYRKIYFDSGVSPGVIELNPIKEDVFEAINKTGIDYALNFVTNNEGKIIAVHGGRYEESWGKAINSLADLPDVATEGSADIVIISAGGVPFDQSLYQASWALINASKSVKKNGTIVFLAECVTGLGADAFTQLARVSESSELKRRFMYGAEALDLLKQVLKNNKIILVSALPTYLVESIGIDVARTANEAYKMAMQSRRGRKTLVIPYGCQTIWNELE